MLTFSQAEKKLVKNLMRKDVLNTCTVHVITLLETSDHSHAGFLSGCSEIHCLSGGRGQTATVWNTIKNECLQRNPPLGCRLL